MKRETISKQEACWRSQKECDNSRNSAAHKYGFSGLKKAVTILMIVSFTLQGCYTSKPTGKASPPDYNKRVSVKNAGLRKQSTAAGIVFSVSLVGASGYVGYQNPFVKMENKETGEKKLSPTASAITGALGGLALNTIINAIAGKGTTKPVSDPMKWIKKENEYKDYRLLSSSGNNFDLIHPSAERNFTVKTINDVHDFNRMFPNSSYTENVINQGITNLSYDTEFQILAQLYPQYTDKIAAAYLTNALQKTTRFDMFRNKITAFPQALQGVDLNINYENEEQIKTLFTQLDNRSAEIGADKLRGFKNEILDKLPVIVSNIDDEYEEMNFHKVTAETRQKPYRDFIERFPHSKYLESVKTKLVDLEAKLAAEHEMLVREEKDNASKYLNIVAQDIFFAEGDGLTFWDWLGSSSQDKKNWNVFVVARVKNEGALPKRVKAKVTLNVTTEMTVMVLLVPVKEKNVTKYDDEWYMEVEPGMENVLVGFFKFQEKAWGEGNLLMGAGSHTYVDKEKGYDINFEYFDEDFPLDKLTKQQELATALRKNGNVKIKEGYASAYQETKAAERQREVERKYKEQCLDCEIDNNKSTLPSISKDWLNFTYEKPGEFITKNGQKYYFYYDKNNGFLVKGIIFDDKYDTWEKMYDNFYKDCLKRNCPSYK